MPKTYTSCSKTKCKLYARQIRNMCGLPRKVKVSFRQVPISKMGDNFTCGVCDLGEDGRYTITIIDSLSPEHTVDILLHEVSHVIQWETCDPDVEDHGPEFGVIFAEIYCKWLGTT